jgi:hypothetical protein
MADETRAQDEPDREAAGPPSDTEPQVPAEPRSVRPHGAGDPVFKHANDRRALDRMLSRMRGR